MPNTLVFNKLGYDPFIDFIKAYAIICVLIGHTFPNVDRLGYGLWAGMQVPLFVLVQAFHFFKKDNSKICIKKIFWRIFFPFLCVEVIIFALLLSVYHYNYKELVHNCILGGGTGPGSYYPWLYLQIALLLPIFNSWMKRMKKFQLAFSFLILCESFEVIFSLVHFPDVIYRLLAIRYIFLLYLAWLWVDVGIVINAKVIIISLLSLLSVIYFEYFSLNDEPLFFSTAWKFHRWPCYYYVAFLGVWLLHKIYQYLSNFHYVGKVIKILAKASYEIFLLQMAVCALFPSLNFITIETLRIVIRMISIFSISIVGGCIFNKVYKTVVLKHVS